VLGSTGISNDRSDGEARVALSAFIDAEALCVLFRGKMWRVVARGRFDCHVCLGRSVSRARPLLEHAIA